MAGFFDLAAAQRQARASRKARSPLTQPRSFPMRRLLQIIDDFENSRGGAAFGAALLFALLFAGLILTGVR